MKMLPNQIAMLCAGVVLFAVAVALLVYATMKNRPVKPALVLLPLAIIMIGFPSFQSVKVPGFEFDEKTAADFASDPNNADARVNFAAELNKLEAARAAVPAQPLSPQVRSNLVAVAGRLERLPNLSSEARATLARTQLLLGQTNQAVASLRSALKINTNLVLDSQMKLFLKSAATPNHLNP
jgi:hypothetical protein